MDTILDLVTLVLGRTFLRFYHVIGEKGKSEPGWKFEIYPIDEGGIISIKCPHSINEHWAFHCYCPDSWESTHIDASKNGMTIHEILRFASEGTQSQLSRMHSHNVDSPQPPHIEMDDINIVIVPIVQVGDVNRIRKIQKVFEQELESVLEL